MSKRGILLQLLFATTLVAAVACSNGGSDSIVNGNGEDLTSAMVEIALESDRMTEELVGTEADALGGSRGDTTYSVERSFERTHACPAGGSLFVDGMISLSFDSATGVLEVESSGSRSATDCAFLRRELTLIVNGSTTWDKFRRRVDGEPDGPQTSHYAGSWHVVRSDGEERSCEVELTIVRDGDTRTRTLEGTICGTRVRHRVSWNRHD